MTELAIVTTDRIQTMIDLVCNAVDSPHTKRAYSRALTDFMAWYANTGQIGFNKATVNAHVASLRSKGVTESSINQRLTAIRKLASELADNGVVDYSTVQAVAKVKGHTQRGKRIGNWLTVEQATALVDLPDTTTQTGLRDRAILAVLLGCGLRREECAGLTVEHIQQREGRWVIVDLVGKRNKTRSVPMPAWTKNAVDDYITAAGFSNGPLFRSMRWTNDTLQPVCMSSQTVFTVVVTYAAKLGVNVRPHDLRRTFAKLAHKGKAPIDQIQFSLGHDSMQTTERYIGTQQDLSDAPCDVLGIKPKKVDS